MILNKDVCNDSSLHHLLCGDEASSEFRSALMHVERCVDCQLRLEKLAAESGFWEEATSILSLINDHDFRLPSEDQWRRDRPPVAWSETMASRLLSPASHPEMLGSIGRYDVESLIGSGGMGLVFKAHDTELNRPVAVKLLAPYLAGIGSARKRFAREARAAAAVVDDHVVAIHNVESCDDSNEAPFLVMRYIAGGSLQQRIDRNGHLDVCEILRIGLHTANGLAAAHAQGLIHRDVKPSNILLDEGVERALLTDFGLARTEEDACLTRSGFHPGTPHYMSPEQVRGESIDGRSDLFGLGCVMYAMCTGHPPFRADSGFAVLRRITEDAARPIREINAAIPVWLEQIVMKLLSKKREDRFESAAAVGKLLAGCLAHVQQPMHAQLPSMVGEVSADRQRKTPWLKVLGAAAGFVAIALAGIVIVLELGKGTLRIECDTDDIPIRVVQGGETVKELTLTRSGKSVRVAAGQYVVEIDGDFAGVEVTGDAVSLSRGGTQVVQITKSNKPSEDTQELRRVEASQSVEQAPVLPVSSLGLTGVPSGTFPMTTANVSPDQQELAALKAEHAEVSQAYRVACDRATDEVELNRVYDEMDPREIMPSQYLAFEEKYRGTNTGLEALIIVSNLATSGGGPSTANGRAEAIGRIIDHYVEFNGLESVVDGLHGGVWAPRETEFLEALIERNPSLQTRAAALLQLIRADRVLLTAETQLPEMRKQAEAYLAAETIDPVTRAQYENYVAQIESTDFGELRKEVNQKLEKLAWYADTKVQFYGTAGNAAVRLRHAVNEVVIGQAAPELEGTDFNGDPFQLSKLKGKIVVLIFSQDKDFGENYGPIRQLVARYRQAPVRVVGVMGNNSNEDLKAAFERSEINWTAIAEPVNGPIFQNWGLRGYPAVFIVGTDGTLSPRLHMPNYGAGGYDTIEVREKLDEYLNEINESKRSKKEKTTQ